MERKRSIYFLNKHNTHSNEFRLHMHNCYEIIYILSGSGTVVIGDKTYPMTSHATIPEHGIDAIAIANEAYTRLKDAIVKEAGDLKYIWSVGRFQGGDAHNVIADNCLLDISFSFYDMAFANRVKNITREICKEIAQSFGGNFEIDWNMSTGPVHNEEQIVSKFRSAMEEDDTSLTQRMSSEDFGWYLTKAPGMIFRF